MKASDWNQIVALGRLRNASSIIIDSFDGIKDPEIKRALIEVRTKLSEVVMAQWQVCDEFITEDDT